MVITEKMLLTKIRVRWCLKTIGGGPQICCKPFFLPMIAKNNSFSGDGREDNFDKDQGEAVFANQRRRSSDLLQMIMTAGMLLTIWTKRRWSRGGKIIVKGRKMC